MTRCVLVLDGYPAVAPPGVDAEEFRIACLCDGYEVIAAMSEITAGLAGDAGVLEEIRWPTDLLIESDGRTLRSVADRIAGSDPEVTELIMVPGDVPDLPEMIIAKIAKALLRADVALAPEVAGHGLAGFGVRLPWPGWLPDDVDLDHDPYGRLSELAPRRNLVVHTPGWHRLRRPDAVHLLDPGLEGWDNLRLLLTRGSHR